MDKNRNENITFPDIDVFPRICAVGRFVRRLLGFLPEDAPEYLSEHYDPLASPVEPVTDWPHGE